MSHEIFIAAILTAATARAAPGDITYELLGGSTILDECGPDCDRVSIQRPLAGVFVLTPQQEPGYYAVSGLDLASPEADYTVAGAGKYHWDYSGKPANEMGLTVSINGVDGISLESGLVPVGDEYPVIDIVVAEPAPRDPLHIYTLHLFAAPQPTSRVRYELVPGEGLKGSFFIDDCLPCGRPTIPVPVEGSFLLGAIEPGAANPTVTYRVDGLDIRSILSTLPDYHITGGGIYRLGGEVAIVQEMRLIVQVVSTDRQESGAILASEPGPPPLEFPDIMAELKHQNPLSDFHVYSLILVAKPGEVVRPEFKRGDTNGDGNIDIGDAVYGLLFLFGHGPDPCRDAMDANDDGELDIADPVRILAYLFSSGGDLPQPFGRCGDDPSGDSLGCESYPPCP